MKNLVRLLLSDSRGTETVEWGLIVGMLVGGLVLVLAAIGGWILDSFDTMLTNLGA